LRCVVHGNPFAIEVARTRFRPNSTSTENHSNRRARPFRRAGSKRKRSAAWTAADAAFRESTGPGTLCRVHASVLPPHEGGPRARRFPTVERYRSARCRWMSLAARRRPGHRIHFRLSDSARRVLYRPLPVRRRPRPASPAAPDPAPAFHANPGRCSLRHRIRPPEARRPPAGCPSRRHAPALADEPLKAAMPIPHWLAGVIRSAGIPEPPGEPDRNDAESPPPGEPDDRRARERGSCPRGRKHPLEPDRSGSRARTRKKARWSATETAR